MKQKLSGKKDTSKSKDENAPASSKAVSTINSKAVPARPPSAVREKPPIPMINDQTTQQFYAEPLPSLSSVPQTEKQFLFVQKLHLCAFTFDFTDHTKQVREKEIKRLTLLELLDYCNSGGGKFNETVSEDIVFMLKCNLFRTLPPARTREVEQYDADEEEPSLDPAWPHLQIVYEFFLRYIVSNDTDSKVAKKYIDQQFILKLLELFDSEDPRERDYVKTVLHRIYGKIMLHRPFIRKSINNIFYRFIFETERHNGISELLEILGSIINGFAIPLKEEHKLFLQRALMPLHKPKCVPMYHQQLAYCVAQFVEKDPKLADPVLRSLLKFWPVTNSQKEVLFLGELEELIELTQPQEFQKVMVPLFKQLAKCFTSQHFQVAERSLFLWNNEYFMNLVAQERHSLLPIFVPALEENAANHWNPTVHGLTCNVRKLFQELDEPLFEDCRRKYEEDVTQHRIDLTSREQKWEALNRAVQTKMANGTVSPANAAAAASTARRS
eukprot:CAMPEP_0175082930 /NCGR_PEP_ID=MMETSP0052_2-20121109/27043_1 /TAXON_ID=51329 ORGANISM="Polytomella parva, Strain SAG 63-3" /NCGR_SAMPLE_ID=MMETSP0052_2 /ASSEMBLY_ACC=CAM_ASM_000194 /LENGTH=497 /DNA_ID=CAMNT_0016354209 /DNA_START=75 /DNA_END=1568 /DNA_ORIENTATION=+